MITKDQFEELTDEEKVVFLCGSSIYRELTGGGKVAITHDVASKLSDDDINIILRYTHLDDSIDFELDVTALDSVMTLCGVLAERHPTPVEDVEAKLSELRAKYLEEA